MTTEQKELASIWWEKMKPLVNKFVRETILAGFDKDDIRQECYMIMSKAVVNYKKESNVPFESYYKIILYGWRSNQNKKHKLIFFGEQEGLNEGKDIGVNVEREIEKKIIYSKVIDEINKLNDIDREIVIKYYMENKSIKEIADKLGVTYKSVEYKKGVIIKKLRKSLIAYEID